MIDTILKIIPALAAILTAIWALYLFNRQQSFRRLQNLSALWKEFFKADELLELFNLMNEVESHEADPAMLARADSRLKLKYLALIEEVALYVTRFEVDKSYASYLFQWHFHFVYGSEMTSAAFWQNLGGVTEKTAPYWRMSRDLAARMTPEI